MTNKDNSYELYADFYDKHVTLMTQPHATDLIGLMEPQIRGAQRILELGCGSGVFGLAYQQFFPQGIEGQTIVCTDLSPAMVELAQRHVSNTAPSATTFTFAVADATNLQEMDDESFDMVVSVFGIFLVPDQASVGREVRRVLQRGGTLAATSWTQTGYNTELKDRGFGTNFQDAWGAMMAPPETVPAIPIVAPPPSVVDWFDRDTIRSFLLNNAFETVTIRHAIHTVTFANVEHLWDAITKSNPFGAAYDNQEPDQVAQTKARLRQAVVGANDDTDSTIFSFLASNLVVAS